MGNGVRPTLLGVEETWIKALLLFDIAIQEMGYLSVLALCFLRMLSGDCRQLPRMETYAPQFNETWAISLFWWAGCAVCFRRRPQVWTMILRPTARRPGVVGQEVALRHAEAGT